LKRFACALPRNVSVRALRIRKVGRRELGWGWLSIGCRAAKSTAKACARCHSARSGDGSVTYGQPFLFLSFFLGVEHNFHVDHSGLYAVTRNAVADVHVLGHVA
jgi:hypothetical protein